MIIVHHLENSRSHRILWLLEELGLPYEIKNYKRDPKTLLAPPDLKQIHPLGKSPVITDEGVCIAESGAIVEYLLDKYDPNEKLRPSKNTPERLRYNYWLHYAEGSAMPYLFISLVFSMLPKQKLPFFLKPVMKAISDRVHAGYINPQLQSHFAFVESELKKSDWLAGKNFTAADIQMSYVVLAAQMRNAISATTHPALTAYIQKLQARPLYKKIPL